MLIKSVNPSYEKIKHLPDRLILNNSVDWKAVQAALGLDSLDKLKDALLWLYMSDAEFNYHANEALLQNSIVAIVQDSKLPPPPPTDQELPWLTADLSCESCPGSEYTEVTPGFSMPLCANRNRVERYADCAKYRENLSDAVIPPEQVLAHYKQIQEDYKEIFNVSISDSHEQVNPGSGPVDANVSLDRNPAADVVSRHFG